jgi:nicotinamide-nucleotide amidase
VRLRAEMDVIIATGGLGPDEDDRTSTSWLSCSSPGRRRRAVADAMKKRFSTHGFELTPNNLRQVRIPERHQGAAQHGRDRARVRPAAGTADAFFLPGVPREMEKMFTDEVMPRLARRLTRWAGEAR